MKCLLVVGNCNGIKENGRGIVKNSWENRSSWWILGGLGLKMIKDRIRGMRAREGVIKGVKKFGMCNVKNS